MVNKFWYSWNLNNAGLVLTKQSNAIDSENKKDHRFYIGASSYPVVDELRKFPSLGECQNYLESLFK